MLPSRNPRRFPKFNSSLLFVVAFVAVVCFFVPTALAQQDAKWEQDLSAWRVQHAAELQKPDGWLALAGLVWLAPGDNSVGSAADSKVKLPASGPAHVGILHLEGDT